MRIMSKYGAENSGLQLELPQCVSEMLKGIEDEMFNAWEFTSGHIPIRKSSGASEYAIKQCEENCLALVCT